MSYIIITETRDMDYMIFYSELGNVTSMDSSPSSSLTQSPNPPTLSYNYYEFNISQFTWMGEYSIYNFYMTRNTEGNVME